MGNVYLYHRIYKSGYWNTYDGQFKPHQNSLSNLKQGNKGERVFKLGRKQRNIFVSRCITLAETRKNYLKTFVLTYREQPKESPHSQLNSFLTNLRKNYGLMEYAWTIEKTKLGVWHYHFILDIPFIKAETINKAWCSARNDYSPNALRALRAVVNPVKVAKYASKYFTKAREGTEDYKKGCEIRLYGTSNGIIGNESFTVKSDKLTEILTENSVIVREGQYNTFGYVKNFSKFVTEIRSSYPPENRNVSREGFFFTSNLNSNTYG